MESSEKTKKKFMNKAHAMGVASAR